MFDNLAKDFISSAIGNDAVDALKKEAGLDQSEATNALSATAHGAVDALSGESGGVAGALGGLLGGSGGAAGALGGLLGGGGGGALGGLLGGGGGDSGGGLGGALGGMLGGGGGGGGLGGMLGGLVGGGNASGLPPAITDKIALFVAEKTGLGADKARLAVNVVVPKIMEFVKAKMA